MRREEGRITERTGSVAWRLLDTGASHPYYNMALDEALLREYSGVPALRFYSWEPPALSLGYFQSAGDFDREDLKKRGCVQDPVKALVQRILQELTDINERHRLFVREPIIHSR